MINLNPDGWKALRVQKMYLQLLGDVSDGRLTHNEMIALKGLLGLVDAIQDQEVMENSSYNVFTHSQLQADSKNNNLEIDDAPWVIIDTSAPGYEWVDAFTTKKAAEVQVKNLTGEFKFKYLEIIPKKEWKARQTKIKAYLKSGCTVIITNAYAELNHVDSDGFTLGDIDTEEGPDFALIGCTRYPIDWSFVPDSNSQDDDRPFILISQHQLDELSNDDRELIEIPA